MNQKQSDQDVVESRKNALKGPDVEVSLRDQVIEKLVKKLEEQGEGQNTLQIWNLGNAYRQDWLTRRQNYLQEYDEFLEPLYSPAQEWSATTHLPVALIAIKTYHARMLAALIGIDPPFTCKARKGANQDRATLIQELMRYTLASWVNEYQGVDEQLDAWLWNWISGGCGILKARWDKKFTRFVDVVKKQRMGLGPVDPATGLPAGQPQPEEYEAEETVTKETFNGPCLENVEVEDVLIVGGGGDPQNADEVLQQSYMTASDLWTLVDTGVFRKEAVEKTIASGENRMGGEAVNAIKEDKAQAAGVSGIDKEFDLPRYRVIERYARLNVDGSGINTDVVIWVHPDTGSILRATYLRRVMQEGLRPFFKIDFHKRHGQDYGIGLVELLYSISKEIDAFHNMGADFGLISSMPFGFYRATSSMTEERIPFEPGSLIPLDNPQADVYFPNLGNRGIMASQEVQALYQWVERLISMSDMQLGIIGGQGAARTATGARALVGEGNANLDVYLRRMNRGWQRAINYIFHMLQHRMPKGFQFRILGDSGDDYWQQIDDKEALEGQYDFELCSNSANSNKQIQLEVANQIVQLTGNPLDVQLGIITPLERFEALKNLLQVSGVKDFARFINKPNNQMRIFSPEEIGNRVLAGINTQLGPEQDLQGFIDYFQHIHDHDELLGQFNEEQTIMLARKAKEAEAMLQAMQQQAAQHANQEQVRMNAGLSQAPIQTPQGAPPQGAAPPTQGNQQ